MAKAAVQNFQSQIGEDMEVFLEKIHQLLPVLGVDLLVTIAGKAATDTEKEMLSCEIKGLKAKVV